MMTTLMTRDEIVEMMAIAAETDFGVIIQCENGDTLPWDDAMQATLRALEAAGCQIVQGEPVAVLLSGGDYPDELEFWNHGTGCLTEADKAAGCTEVLLFAKVQP